MINAGVIEQYWYVWVGGGKGGSKINYHVQYLCSGSPKKAYCSYGSMVGKIGGSRDMDDKLGSARSQATVRGRVGRHWGDMYDTVSPLNPPLSKYT